MPGEHYLPDCIVKFGGRGIMVWAAPYFQWILMLKYIKTFCTTLCFVDTLWERPFSIPTWLWPSEQCNVHKDMVVWGVEEPDLHLIKYLLDELEQRLRAWPSCPTSVPDFINGEISPQEHSNIIFTSHQATELLNTAQHTHWLLDTYTAKKKCPSKIRTNWSIHGLFACNQWKKMSMELVKIYLLWFLKIRCHISAFGW